MYNNLSTPLNDMNLLRMNWLKKYSKKIGFSDHSLVERDGIIASKVAYLKEPKLSKTFYRIGQRQI